MRCSESQASAGFFPALGGTSYSVLLLLIASHSLAGIASPAVLDLPRSLGTRLLESQHTQVDGSSTEPVSDNKPCNSGPRTPLLRRNFTLPRSFRHAAISTIVPTMQTYKLARLLRGDLGNQTLRMAVLGGSFSCTRHGIRSWFQQLGDELTHLLPNLNISAVPRARGASHPYHAGFCLESLLGTDPYDLVFVEFNPNTVGTLHHPAGGKASRLWSLQFEMLMRKLLKWPGSPQIVVVQTLLPKDWVDGRRMHFWEGSEEGMGVVAKYYSIPTVSMRDAVWTLQRADMAGFRQDDMRADHIHLNLLGMRYLVDMVVHSLEEMVKAVAAGEELDTQGEVLRPAPLAVEDITYKALHPHLLPPMQPDLHVPKTRLCFVATEDAFGAARALNLTIEPSSGFHLAFHDGSNEKVGFLTDAETGAGEHIDFTWTPPERFTVAKGRSIMFVVGFLISYTSVMADARISCLAGCKCAPVTARALQAARTSFESIAAVKLTSWSGEGSCTVRVRVQKGPQGGTKFKVTQLWVLDGTSSMDACVRAPDQSA